MKAFVRKICKLAFSLSCVVAFTLGCQGLFAGVTSSAIAMPQQTQQVAWGNNLVDYSKAHAASELDRIVGEGTSDRLEGQAEQAVGSTQRQFGKVSGQVEGTTKQAEGKVKEGVGQTKNAFEQASEKVQEQTENAIDAVKNLFGQ
ncbi:MAG: CsbD family protein [Cyanobacteria bacterium CRU_2_1]|nr:CsbD family protein [Cyanobacteria bacterium RU_5_0]NJR57921.1 CsbD family protein [Cyanobacteria bacterium CRU_2_1]